MSKLSPMRRISLGPPQLPTRRSSPRLWASTAAFSAARGRAMRRRSRQMNSPAVARNSGRNSAATHTLPPST